MLFPVRTYNRYTVEALVGSLPTLGIGAFIAASLLYCVVDLSVVSTLSQELVEVDSYPYDIL